jgi:uncharacterized protein (DUF1499 family)
MTAKHLAANVSAVFALVLGGCGASMPSNLGMTDGKLSPCPSAPHCVSTQEGAVEPAPYQTSREEARKRLLEIIRSMPRAKIVTVAPDYIHAEFTSRIFRYVDDVEIYLDDRAKLAHFRSSSRIGYYDLGVNKGRVAGIRKKFLAAGS